MHIKRECKRFSIPGTTLYYKVEKRFWRTPQYGDAYFPVLNLSRGGLSFLSHNKIKAGTSIRVKLAIPGDNAPVELKAVVRWIALNPEHSYRYQNGIAFNSYGRGKNENDPTTLSYLKNLENLHLM